jgi:hypothetical protein
MLRPCRGFRVDGYGKQDKRSCNASHIARL